NNNNNNNNVTVTGYFYVPSEKFEKQGKRRDMEKYFKQGYEVFCEKNGYWVLGKSSQTIVNYEFNGNSNSDNVKPLIRDYFNKERVTKKLFNEFMDEYEEGRFDFGCSGDKLFLKNN
ncbi:MAG: hypothetical protein J6M60_07550, partial [Clostridia bacterium]|nr:hypothetical protein [Clostridia bacterium]